MDALDLTQRPPRSPRELLPGLDLLMAARTVDKMRATLPGGNIGEYQITGFSSSLLNALEIAEATLRGAIARADTDAQVAIGFASIVGPNVTPKSMPNSRVEPSASVWTIRSSWPAIRLRGGFHRKARAWISWSPTTQRSFRRASDQATASRRSARARA